MPRFDFSFRGWSIATTGLLGMTVALIAGDAAGQQANVETEPIEKFHAAHAVLTRYCAGCHREQDINGEFRVDDYNALMAGGEHGKTVTPGSAASSRLIALMRRKLEPAMPPEGEPAPTADEIQVVAEWIDAGAVGPAGDAILLSRLDVPEVESKTETRPVTALALAPDQQQLAVGRYQSLVLTDAATGKVRWQQTGLPGKVNAIAFSPDGRFLVAGSGTTGLFGEAVVLAVADGSVQQRFRGHRDSILAVDIAADGSTLVTGSYDQTAMLWHWDPDAPRPTDSMQTRPDLTFTGHNDAVFDVLLHPDGKRLITASADATIKIWDRSTGQRLDTRGEPLEAQTTLALGPTGRYLTAAGDDHRIRRWDLGNTGATAPLLTSRFAHQSAIEMLALHPDGKFLVSVGAAGDIKIWDWDSLTQRYAFDPQPDTVAALAIGHQRIHVARMDGAVETLDWPPFQPAQDVAALKVPPVDAAPAVAVTAESTAQEEHEPNDTLAALEHQSPPESPPFQVTGVIGQPADQDLFAFHSESGQTWILEARAVTKDADGKTAPAKTPRPLDTHIEVLDAAGQPVPRVWLQAVRDSYFTFRGKNSTQTNDFRIHNWEEMHLGQLLYCNGEVVKLFHYPRGPDSGFNVYPNFGNRFGMFETTPIAHALHEPCYIVQPHPPGTKLPDNGLPMFEIPFVNDDDAEREWGTDSRLTFVAPESGIYYARLSDARGFGGPEYHYQLHVRAPQPDFRIRRVLGKNPTVPDGGYAKLGVELDRIDGFDGPVEITLEDLPDDLQFLGPVSVNAGALQAFGALHASPRFAATGASKEDTTEAGPTESPQTEAAQQTETDPQPTVVATATIDGRRIQYRQPLGKITVSNDVKLHVRLEPADTDSGPRTADRLPVLSLAAGSTAEARIVVQRTGYDQRINFGKESAAINAPFGAYVANTGLNGVLIPPDANQRVFQITAEPWMQPGEHLIFVAAEEAGRPASNPILLKILEAAKPTASVSKPHLESDNLPVRR